MACDVSKAIPILLKNRLTSKAVSDIINNGKIVEEKFGKLVKEATGKDVSDISLKEFSKSFKKILFTAAKPSVKKAKNFILPQIKLGMQSVAQAVQHPDGILIGEYVSDKDVRGKIADEVYTELSSSVYTANEIDQAVDKEVARVLAIVKGARGSAFLLHELIHTGAREFMLRNPNEEASQRITTIYNYLVQNKEDLGITDGYWTTNVDEFLAEALSNPEFMKELMQVVAEKPLSRLSNMYEIVLNTLLQMLGFKGKELNSIFDVLLDANLKILESKRFEIKAEAAEQVSSVDKMKSLNSEREAIINKLKTAPVGIRKIIMDNLSKCSGV